MKNCPYCGRRISYFTVFHEKKHGLYTCRRCHKESKVKTDFRLLAAFAAVALLMLLFIIVWNNSEFYDSFWGVVIVAAVLTVFYFLTPVFVRFIPLRRYLENEEEPEIDITSAVSGFKFNRDVFDTVMKNRKKAKLSEEAPQDPEIKPVSSAHSSSDAPLKRVHTRERAHEEEQVRTYVPKHSAGNDKKTGSHYTGNRKL